MSTRKPESARQMPLSLPHEVAFGRADFIEGRANREALAVIDGWPGWPERGVLLVGPPGSGKSHLAAIWQAASGGARAAAATLSENDADRLAAAGAAVVEDLHLGPIDEPALFHLINAAAEQGASLLLTSRIGPAALGLKLPDLESRLRAMRLTTLYEPDDELLRQVLTKLFADRQLLVDPSVIEFIVVRMERSLEAANWIADELDRGALAENRAITRRLAGEVFARLIARQESLWTEPD